MLAEKSGEPEVGARINGVNAAQYREIGNYPQISAITPAENVVTIARE